jgi:plasmid maintenance system antidote protein VapI
MNLELRIALIRRFGSQIRAAKPLKIDESRLSRIVNGHRDPTEEERQRLTSALGADYFASDRDGEAVGA